MLSMFKNGVRIPTYGLYAKHTLCMYAEYATLEVHCS